MQTLKFNSSMDKMSKWVTIGAILLFVCIAVAIWREPMHTTSAQAAIITKAGVTLLLTGILLVCWLYAPKGYSVSDSALIIHRSAANKQIALNRVNKILLLTKEDMKGSLRAFGVGGL